MDNPIRINDPNHEIGIETPGFHVKKRFVRVGFGIINS